MIVEPKITIMVAPERTATSPPLFNVNEDYTLTCKAEGYPQPRVSWNFAPCTQSNQDCTVAVIPSDRWSELSSKHLPEAPVNEKVFTINRGRLAPPGVFRCVAKADGFDPVFQDVHYFPTGLFKNLVIASRRNRNYVNSLPD